MDTSGWTYALIQGNESAPASTVVEVPTAVVDGLPAKTVPVLCDAQRRFHVSEHVDVEVRAFLLERGWIDGAQRQEVLTPAPDLQAPQDEGGQG